MLNPIVKEKKTKRNVWTDPSGYGTYEGERGSSDQWKMFFGIVWNKITAKTIIKEKSPWEILGIVVGSSEDTIKKAFRKLLMINHPDKGGDPEICKQIIAAYVMLTDIKE